MEGANQEFNGQRVSAMAFAAKFKSKKEVFNFLTIVGKAYLPPFDTISIYHMRDIVSGKKKVCSSLFLPIEDDFSNFFLFFSLYDVTQFDSCMCPSTLHLRLS